MNWLEGCRLDVRDQDAVKRLLKFAGLRGPWIDRAEYGSLLTIREQTDGSTLVGIDIPHEPHAALRLPEATALPDRVSTVLVHRSVGASRSLLFPLRLANQIALRLPGGGTWTRVLARREDGSTLAAATPELGGRMLLGFSLSDFCAKLEVQHDFHGAGHLAELIRWFLDTVAKCRWIRVSPWRNGTPPLLVSFDVEAGTPRRSVGRRILRGPGFELNHIRLPRPLRSKRIVFGRNVLRDPDGDIHSRRITVDLRRARVGCAHPSHEVDQWQFHIRMPNSPSPSPSHDPSFRRFASETCQRFVNFYCGGLPSEPVEGEEIGFHGTDHRHFHLLGPDDLNRELACGRGVSTGGIGSDLIRAPGLCWSHRFFDRLGTHGYRVDSSFREVNDLQPVIPIQTRDGWWELPVHGNLIRCSPDDPRGLFADGMINVYCHDHELRDEAARTDFQDRLGRFAANGRTACGMTELTDWLERSLGNEVLQVRHDVDGWRVRAMLAEGSAVVSSDSTEAITSPSDHRSDFRLDSR